MTSGRRRSSATWLLLAYAALVVYASLYPFLPWHWPPGLALENVLRLSWPKYSGTFDIQANLAGYLPLGLLGFAAGMRSGLGLRGALAVGLLPWPLMSLLLEYLQYFLPNRVPSLADWVLNSAGAAIGVVLALLLNAFGGLRRIDELRDYWFQPNSAGALALLALWPVGLLFPAPVPLGLGQWLPRLQAMAVDLFEGTPWELRWGDQMASGIPLPPGLEVVATALGLLAPVLLALSVARPGVRRLGLVIGALLLGMLGTALSTALNFGPDHAWAWLTLATWPGLAIGAFIAALATLLPRRVSAALALIVLCTLIALVSLAPPDPYLTESLQGWEQGRFINLYGLAQWIGWVWPFAAIGWLLTLIGRRSV